jgi:hypothetical protein
VFDVESHQVTTLPDSAGKFSPHWSPDGQFIFASALGNYSLYLFEIKTQRWTQIYKGLFAYGNWSRDSRFIYFLRFASDPAVLRVPVKGGKPQLVTDLKDIHYTGALGLWLGLDPSDAPLLLRDMGTRDVYALSLEQR